MVITYGFVKYTIAFFFAQYRHHMVFPQPDELYDQWPLSQTNICDCATQPHGIIGETKIPPWLRRSDMGIARKPRQARSVISSIVRLTALGAL